MKTIRRRRSIVTERYESTVIRLEPGSFQICPGCIECDGYEDTENQTLGLEQVLSSGRFSVSGVDHGKLILCLKATNR